MKMDTISQPGQLMFEGGQRYELRATLAYDRKEPYEVRLLFPLTLFVGAGARVPGLGSPVVPVWLFAPCSSHGLGGVAAGIAGA